MIARTVRLDADVDLLAVAGPDGFLFEQHGAGLAGRGVAARLSLEEAPDALAAIRSEDEVGLPGCGPVAFGALPFSHARSLARSSSASPRSPPGSSPPGSTSMPP
jgi:menaquinone-specific isochorismate synthase